MGGTESLSQLSDIISQIGSPIGDSIAARLAGNGSVERSAQGQSSDPTYSSAHSHNSAHSHEQATRTGTSGIPHIIVNVRPDREPTIFRGDHSDKYTVTEWIELMKAYIRKQGFDASVQAEEIQSKLMGRARDVVSIGLGSDPSLDCIQHPEVIYNILLSYFSNTSSCLPLADFYSTQPKPKENPVDYWIRVNKAADLADEGLRRQGRRMENMGEEVACMFVKHCPDTELAYAFKSKPIHEWTAKQIQERIDEFQREHG